MDPEKTTELDELEDRGDNYVPDDEEEVLEDEETSEEELEDEEDEQEDEEDSESEGDEDEDEEEDEDDEEEPRIPRSRLNQVIAQRDEEREQRLWMEEQFEKLVAMQQSAQAPAAPKEEAKPKVNISALRRQSNEAFLEGDLDKVSELQDQIHQAEKEEMMELIKGVKEENKTEVSESLENTRFERVVEQAQMDYEFLDADSDQYDEKAVNMINAIMGGKVLKGIPKSKALKEAIDDVVPLFYDFEEEAPKPKKESMGKSRTKAARKKAAKASQQQPPETRRAAKGKAARDLDKIDVAKMSDKEYSQLTLRERKALRGD